MGSASNITVMGAGTPTQVTTIAKDAAVTVSWIAPSDAGISGYRITPYINGVAQTATTVSASSVTTLQTAASTHFTQADVTGLTNNTAYTFSVAATDGTNYGPESAVSGSNTPQAGLIFGDEFNGSYLDPAWVVLTRDSDQSNSELIYYLPSQVSLDGNSHLQIVMAATPHTGPGYLTSGGADSYPAAGVNVTRNYISGFVQMRYFNYKPGTKTIKIRSALQVPGGNWPSIWQQGMNQQQVNSTSNTYNDGIGGCPDNVGPDQVTLLNNPNGVGGAWKLTANWDAVGGEEIDVAEWVSAGTGVNEHLFASATGELGSTVSVSNFLSGLYETGIDWVAGSSIQWMTGPPTSPGTGAAVGTAQTLVSNANVPSTPEFLMLNMTGSSANGTSTGTMLVDYVRIFEV